MDKNEIGGVLGGQLEVVDPKRGCAACEVWAYGLACLLILPVSSVSYKMNQKIVVHFPGR